MNQHMEKQTAGVQHVSQMQKKVNKDIVARIKVFRQIWIVTMKFLWSILTVLIGDFVTQIVMANLMLVSYK